MNRKIWDRAVLLVYIVRFIFSMWFFQISPNIWKQENNVEFNLKNVQIKLPNELLFLTLKNKSRLAQISRN